MFGTQNQGTSFTDLTANLAPLHITAPTSVEFVSNNGVNALLVGGLNNIANAQSPIAVADSDTAGNLSGWRALGVGLPNTFVGQMLYNPAVDVLSVGTFGRGAFVLYDFTSYFQQASVLQFGLANNDSTPDASFLTNGPSASSRPLIKYGTGMLTIAGNASYTGATTVNGGVLNVPGSIEPSALTTVNANALLMGSGAVGSTVIASGGSFAPGNGNAGSAMKISGSLALQSGALYLVQVNATGSSLAQVSGSAALGGASVSAIYTSSTLISRQHIILSASGGLSGSFGALNAANTPQGFTSGLGYDANNAYLTYSLAPAVQGGLTGNEQNVLNAITHSFNSGSPIPVALGSLSPAGLTQLSGETATGSQQTTFQAMTQFLGSLLDPFVGGRGEAPTSPAARSFAAEDDGANAYASGRRKRTAAEREAHAIVTAAAARNDLLDPHWSVWAAGFGGSQTTDGNLTLGSSTVTSRVVGTVVGADYLLSPRTIAGFAMAGGATSFSLANTQGSGRSDLFQAGAFVRHTAGQAYVAAALAYGWQDVTTDRTVTIAGVDQLRARFNANAFSGRLEGGYRVVSPWMGIGITPYAAGQFTTFNLPAYAEAVLSGNNTFALSYGASSVTAARAELGARMDRSYALETALLTLRSRFAWAHDFNTGRNLSPTFQTLPGASFVVNGAAPAADAALTTASAELKWRSGVSLAAVFEGEFSDTTRSYAGKGVARYMW